MRPLPAPRRGQRGIVLIALLAVLLLGSSWLLLSKLNVSASERVAAKRERNAAVLNLAKQALIGYVVQDANEAEEKNPGHLPCPENAGDFDNADGRQGLGGINCGSTIRVGRFPWKTLGLDKLVDADGEPLWYVLSPNWGLDTGAGVYSYINSNSVGNLTVDGVANAAVALIIAPGAALNATTSSGCTAWNQTRSLTGPPDWRNYLECDNATSPADVSFITTGPSGAVFNDQVVVVKVEDIMPGLEAAIANRIQREIVPALNTVYTPGTWGLTGSNPLYPFAVPFDAPGPGAGSSSYKGALGTYQGLFPFNQTQGCTVTASNPRCVDDLLTLSKGSGDTQTGGAGSIRTDSTCSLVSNLYTCTGTYNQPSIYLDVKIKIANVAMGLRALNTTNKVTCGSANDVSGGWTPQTMTCSITDVSLQPDGSAVVTISAGPTTDINAAGWGSYANYTVTLDPTVIVDHGLLDSTIGLTGWFFRNDWFRFTYYAVAQGATTGAATFPSTSCTTNGSGSAACLSIASNDPANPVSPPGGQRAILVLAGRSLSTQSRPAIGSSALTDYLEAGNTTGAYERRKVARSVTIFNDRVVVVGSN